MMPPAPGLAVIDNPNIALPPRVKPPKPEHIEWAKAELKHQAQERLALDKKLFIIRK
jgi:hypothetical protein